MAEYIISLSLLICVVLLIRAIFRKSVSPRVIYGLWLVVAIRLLLPVTLFQVDVTLPDLFHTESSGESSEIERPVESTDLIVQPVVQPSPVLPVESLSPETPIQNITQGTDV